MAGGDGHVSVWHVILEHVRGRLAVLATDGNLAVHCFTIGLVCDCDRAGHGPPREAMTRRSPPFSHADGRGDESHQARGMWNTDSATG